MLSGAGQDWTGSPTLVLRTNIQRRATDPKPTGTGIADIKDIGFPYNTFYFH